MSQAVYQHEPSPAKKRQLKELIELLQEYESIGITGIENIAAKTIQRIRHSLRGEAKLKVAKNTLMRLALEKVAKERTEELQELESYIHGSCAFVLTDSNPFKIANFLEKNKIPTPAKEGQIAPNDVIVTARDTGFAPGPVIGELQSVGLTTQIEGGTIKITENAVVCKKGEKVSRTLANVLNRLGVEPFTAGLSIEAIFSEGEILTHEVLIVDFDEQRESLIEAYQQAFGLSLELYYPTKQNIQQLLGKTRREALSLALETEFITPETASNILAKTQLEAIALAQKIMAKDPEVLPPELLSLAQETQASSPSAKSETTTEDEDSKEEEPEEEEEEDTGMGSLFG
ncbi:MAG: 50S ribosomal protein L10 [Candidatus Heimdallarchaeota archaeon]|nr:50S ribosomal protein L10 [Candidatus Heimdallarchaeota archaeon]